MLSNHFKDVLVLLYVQYSGKNTKKQQKQFLDELDFQENEKNLEQNKFRERNFEKLHLP